ncbi:amidohydrolase [Salipaludibacillus keqinensis]|uniref:Amidohydrolase n=2 Tax=Salipaludibacillus keqinensis TaxID=2045207 RepID=A0A323TMP7_9BACI|nr:amidohydrolase [Salipaludibacillus keqinensis]
MTLKASQGIWTSITTQDHYIHDNSFMSIEEKSDCDAMEMKYDAKAKMVLPGLIDAHVHLDKAYTIDSIGNESGTLLEAIQNFKQASPDFSKEVIKERMKKTVNHAVSFGTSALRSHLDFNMSDGGEIAQRTIEAALEVKEEMKPMADLQFFPMCDLTQLSARGKEILELGLREGLDGIGGAPHLSDQPKESILQTFQMAEKMGKPIDLHSDESDDPSIETVNEIARQTIQFGFQGKVNVGHLCSLAAMSQEKADETIANISEAKLNVITLPGANMYLQGRNDKGLIRRGVTRVKELTGAGVKTAVASDNIQDPFHPFGKGDLVEIGRLSTYAAHMNSEADKLMTLRMVTEIPAELMGLDKYGMKEGNPVSFTIFDATTVNELFSWTPVGRWVYRNSAWVCITKQMQSWKTGQEVTN